MGGIFFVITTLFRTVFLLLVGASITVISATKMAEANQNLYNPFTPYGDFMPGQTWDDVESRGLRCDLEHLSSSYAARCSVPLLDREISKLSLGFSYTNQLTHAIFTFRETLTLGHLILLWGEPEIEFYGQLAFLSWRRHRITATAQTYNHHISYWLPIIDVAFDFAD